MNKTPWHTIQDWAKKSNAEVAQELGITVREVGEYRCHRKLPKGPRSPGSGMYWGTKKHGKTYQPYRELEKALANG